MFDMRKSAEADGETRMIGSGRRAGLVSGTTRCCGWALGSPWEDFVLMNVCAFLRTCEKSYSASVSHALSCKLRRAIRLVHLQSA